jgi:hypothetical protein
MTNPLIAERALHAVHERDHHHQDTDCCHPHNAEMIYFGKKAMVLCHDCSFEISPCSPHDCVKELAAHTVATR